MGESTLTKMKTHSGAKKRFRLTASGKVRRGHAMKRHNMRKRPTDMKRDARGMCIMDACDAKVIKKSFLPYGLD
ncbi:50S ribosomal protein L35 [Holospora undulata HU1]|uniref:Large ribosomal subunit protein bL35 n=2 Tax=Holospora TaxID=44747 RepID=A0A061JHF2_9PROT|nr:50S ribosomal protein L35 [Holospora undulata HU1]GAJ45917.1 50S ribosomal protein L35 [Holospora elegans E1]